MEKMFFFSFSGSSTCNELSNHVHFPTDRDGLAPGRWPCPSLGRERPAISFGSNILWLRGAGGPDRNYPRRAPHDMRIIDGNIKLKMRAQKQSISCTDAVERLDKVGGDDKSGAKLREKRLVTLWLVCFVWFSQLGMHL